MEGIIREACVETLEQCLQAEAQGADRLELCARLDLGGTTPPKHLIALVLERVNIPVKVMIRPRGGHFVYTPKEGEQMKQSIMDGLKLGVPEFVFGALTPNRHIDFTLLEALCDAVSGRPVTFHKAIDEVADIQEAIAQLKAIPNLKYMLTSGGAPTARAGLEQLRKIKEWAAPEITLIAAGGITKGNLPAFHHKLEGSEYHGRRIVGPL